MRLSRWSILAIVIVAILLSSCSSLAQSQRGVVTITVTTPESAPYTFNGVPDKLKEGTYKFKYINVSTIPHSFKIRGIDGFQSTPLCARCANAITVTLSRYADNGKLSPNRMYFCERHKSKMNGTVRIAPAT